MIYFVSDLHGNINLKGFQEYLSTTKDDDLLIILGDICLNFEDTEENRIFTKSFLAADKKIAFIDGNHENFAYINSFPEVEWNGGTVGRLTDNIVFLKRGNVYNIQGKTFFVFGGCKSSSKWKEMGLWYPGEEASEEEVKLAYENIKKHNFKFDYILTHKYEQNTQAPTMSIKLLELTEYIEKNVCYDKWYCGHSHVNKKMDEKHTVIYDELTEARGKW